MTKKVPDYNRILGVQPDASLQVIKGAYRKLMVEMKMHPDLGGDHAKAAAINEAYAVLCTRARRATGEVATAPNVLEFPDFRAATVQPHAAPPPAMPEMPRPQPVAPPARPSTQTTVRTQIRNCPFCGATAPQWTAPETRCERCNSPLSRPPVTARETFGRRSSRRTPKSNLATVYTAQNTDGLTVRMRDLSLNGISFFSETPLDVNQAFQFYDASLEAVGSVVSCKRSGQSYTVHARLLTVAFHYKAGVFVSTTG